MQKILVIQTAFIGDVVLATGLLEKLYNKWPDLQLDILVRKGNESLFIGHPFIHEVLIWDKKKSKYAHFFSVLQKIRSEKYDTVINIQRFTATGLLTVFSKASQTIGFKKNPFSLFFTVRIPHTISSDSMVMHEIDRNQLLIKAMTDETSAKPKLYPSGANQKAVMIYKQKNYVCIAPASVWFTKQFPADQWVQFINLIPATLNIYLLGGAGDEAVCEDIRKSSVHPAVISLAGKLNFLESASLLKDALMNYVNDSAPMHFASAVNAPVTAIFCSTIPAFGFGPLSDNSHLVQIEKPLACRPCGLHGKKKCPLSHYDCALQITATQLLAHLPI